MLGVTVLCVGKMRERYFSDAYGEYAKRLGAFCRLDTLELPETRLPERPSAAEIAAALRTEGGELSRRIPRGAYTAALCVEGRPMKSDALAALMSEKAASGISRFCFIVGGSFGLSEEVKARADLRLSMSEMTFPHHLARVMLAEQLYRAFSIGAGTRYHK